MLTIILGILAIILFGFIAIRFEINDRELLSRLSLICAMLSVCVILAGLGYPFSGYTDWKPTDRKDLVSLSNSTGVSGTKGIIYISISSSNVSRG